MPILICLTLTEDHAAERLLPELREFLLVKGLVEGLDYDLENGTLGDPLPHRSPNPSIDASIKQLKLFNWKLGELTQQFNDARREEKLDDATMDIVRDTIFIAEIEAREHRSGATPLTKRRIHNLIDAILDCLKEVEFSVAEN